MTVEKPWSKPWKVNNHHILWWIGSIGVWFLTLLIVLARTSEASTLSDLHENIVTKASLILDWEEFTLLHTKKELIKEILASKVYRV